MKVRTPRAGLRGAMVTEGAEVADWMFGVFIVSFVSPFALSPESAAGGAAAGSRFRGDPPWAPRRKAAQVKGEEARNKLNTTSRSAYVVLDSGATSPPGLPRSWSAGLRVFAAPS